MTKVISPWKNFRGTAELFRETSEVKASIDWGKSPDKIPNPWLARYGTSDEHRCR